MVVPHFLCTMTGWPAGTESSGILDGFDEGWLPEALGELAHEPRLSVAVLAPDGSGWTGDLDITAVVVGSHPFAPEVQELTTYLLLDRLLDATQRWVLRLQRLEVTFRGSGECESQLVWIDPAMLDPQQATDIQARLRRLLGLIHGRCQLSLSGSQDQHRYWTALYDRTEGRTRQVHDRALALEHAATRARAHAQYWP